MTTTGKKVGRPTKPARAGERASLGLRVTAELKDRLEVAAKESGRSQSQEAEFRLESSFEKSSLRGEVMTMLYGSELAGLLMMIGATMRDLGPSAAFSSTQTLEGSQRWLDDPYAFEQAVRAANRILQALRPSGDPSPPKTMTALAQVDPALGEMAINLGEGFANSMIEAVGRKGVTAQLIRDGAEIAELLGPIAKRLSKGTRQ